MIQTHQKHLPNTFTIAGNVGTPETVRELGKMQERMLQKGVSVRESFALLS